SPDRSVVCLATTTAPRPEKHSGQLLPAKVGNFSWPSAGTFTWPSAPGCQAASSDSTEELHAPDPSAQVDNGGPRSEQAQQADETNHSDPTEATSTPTRWQRLPVPPTFKRGGRGFERPDRLLATLAAEFIDLSPGEGGNYARLRLHEKGKRHVGEVLVDELPDDSVAAYELRATMVEDDKGWHVAKLVRRQLCRRGASGHTCN
ncbi:MAG TPA: hypothetical protein VM307_08840, partial [Egibacteraceae bacterium]|nr:hypothetical protein [Egibacteraceae bacterium]